MPLRYFFGVMALPMYGCFMPIEEELHVFASLANKNDLDIVCGCGHFLKWYGDHSAKNGGGWISNKQIENITKLLTDY